jgi:hypothetical protein
MAKEVIFMTRFYNSEIIKNPFRMYRYEVIGAYRDFLFSDAQIPLRPSMDEDGYDDVTDFDRFEDFSDEIKEHYLPFMGQITENEYFDNHYKLSYEDLKVTQGWTANPSDALNLFTRLKNEDNKVRKIDEAEFLKSAICFDYIRKDGAELTLDDIKSFDIDITYYYERNFDAVLLELKNINFNVDVERKPKSEFDSGFYVPSDVIKYYFGIDKVFHKHAIVEGLLQKELLISPAMILNSDLYLKIRDKVRYLNYEVSREK